VEFVALFCWSLDYSWRHQVPLFRRMMLQIRSYNERSISLICTTGALRVRIS
jgi:hypothetical protein